MSLPDSERWLIAQTRLLHQAIVERAKVLDGRGLQAMDDLVVRSMWLRARAGLETRRRRAIYGVLLDASKIGLDAMAAVVGLPKEEDMLRGYEIPED
jgi:hypothetical protein